MLLAYSGVVCSYGCRVLFVLMPHPPPFAMASYGCLLNLSLSLSPAFADGTAWYSVRDRKKRRLGFRVEISARSSGLTGPADVVESAFRPAVRHRVGHGLGGFIHGGVGLGWVET